MSDRRGEPLSPFQSTLYHSFKTRLGPAGRSETQPGRVKEKTGKREPG